RHLARHRQGHTQPVRRSHRQRHRHDRKSRRHLTHWTAQERVPRQQRTPGQDQGLWRGLVATFRLGVRTLRQEVAMTPARRQERGESRQGRVKALPLRGDRPYTGDVARAGSSRGIEVPLVGWALAGFGPIVVAAALVPLREELVSTNLALI